MLDLRNIRFALAAHSPADFPRDGRPQVCFAGRSNVGKSSLLNTLVGRSDLARTSKTPGRTREIHFYSLAERAYLVDLPGYGYAKVSKGMRRQWGRLIEAYLTDNDALRLMVAILDVRHDPSSDDLDLIAWLESQAIPYVLALTKSDKVSNNVAANQHRRILEVVDSETTGGKRDDAPSERRAIRFSAKTGEGRNELVRTVLRALGFVPATDSAASERLSQ